MKNMKYLFLLAAFLLVGNSAFALNCNESRMVGGSADDCYTSVTVASNETTLVSEGTVLVYDIANAQNNANNSAYQVRVSTASSQGVRVAGVAQRTIASGESALVLVRGKGTVALNSSATVTSGDALFVGVSGDATQITSTTQEQLAFVLENQTGSGGTNSRTTKKAYITVI